MDSNNMNNQNFQQQPYQQQNYQQPYQQTYQQPAYNNYNQTPQIPDEYKPISMWGYLGYEFLFCLPFVGFIIAVVMAFAPENKNVKNFARSYLLAIVIGVVLALIFCTLFGATILAILQSV